ncbi:uncharacterized protein KY384_003120 [Bacidia gigantensis]|uniref:uncharacterized protein n=1 Tax=Bacidia gigantensis TaxID=2732470 RepID=UPI001D04C389|nr:uncharacterized protein KY384_003120 [Bacidia gigantensis]KAG8531491.1 hypothetical protein KY384_003120 [Bacidia gigantensis]
MAGSPVAVASAVILPETEDSTPIVPPTVKRRRSSESSPHSKRARLSQNAAKDDQESSFPRPNQLSREDRLNERRKTGPLEERKRGQRLFGALLGTLSQSSSSTASKRRADIEDKQRTKLKQQNEEENEKKRANIEAIIEVRRQEQKIFDRQSMRLRHSRALAKAHYLQTKAEPKLYYKPWELLPDEEAKIKAQIKNVEETIGDEDRRLVADHPPSAIAQRDTQDGEAQEPNEDTVEDTVEDDAKDDGKEVDTDISKHSEPFSTNEDDIAMHDSQQQHLEDQAETAKDTAEDGGEMVEGEEDTKVHGWPDLAVGWRYQIPMLTGSGYQVIAPDCIGYGGTQVPRVPPAAIESYSWKSHAQDIHELARQLALGRVILGGHDWGGLIAYRVALWFPELVTHVFSVCTPYFAPTKTFVSREKLVEQGMKNLTYQMQLKSGIVEERIVTRDDIKSMLCAAYGGRGPNGEYGFDVRVGFLFNNLPKIKTTPLVDEKTMDHYVNEFAKTGVHQTSELR